MVKNTRSDLSQFERKKQTNKNNGLFFIVSNPAFCLYVIKSGSCPENKCLFRPSFTITRGFVKCCLAVTDLVSTDMCVTKYI